MMLGKVPSFSLAKTQMAFIRKHVRGELAEQQKDDSGVSKIDAELSPSEMEPLDVGGNQIEQKDNADRVTRGENWDLPHGIRWTPPDEETLKPPVLRSPQPLVHLGQRTEEDQDNTQGQASYRESQRGEEFPDRIEHG